MSQKIRIDELEGTGIYEDTRMPELDEIPTPITDSIVINGRVLNFEI
jgi:hypothetical protein